MLGKISQSQKDKYHLHEVSKVVKLIEAESRMVAARSSGEEEMGSCYSMGIEFEDEKVLGICYITMYIQ